MLDDWSLVLNRNWVPINVTTVLRAICKVYEGRARAVDPDNYSVHDFESWVEAGVVDGRGQISTTTLQIPVPEVIVLTRYGGIPSRVLSFSRWNLLRRDQYTCQYCGDRPGRDRLTIDHVVPRSRGGQSGWDNCVVACQHCNTRKGNRSPKEAGLKLRVTPSRPKWSPRLAVGDVRDRESWKRFFP